MPSSRRESYGDQLPRVGSSLKDLNDIGKGRLQNGYYRREASGDQLAPVSGGSLLQALMDLQNWGRSGQDPFKAPQTSGQISPTTSRSEWPKNSTVDNPDQSAVLAEMLSGQVQSQARSAQPQAREILYQDANGNSINPQQGRAGGTFTQVAQSSTNGVNREYYEPEEFIFDPDDARAPQQQARLRQKEIQREAEARRMVLAMQKEELERNRMLQDLEIANSSEDRQRRMATEDKNAATLAAREAAAADIMAAQNRARQEFEAMSGLPYSPEAVKQYTTIQNEARVEGEFESRYRQLDAQEMEFNQTIDAMAAGETVPTEAAQAILAMVPPGQKLTPQSIAEIKAKFKANNEAERKLANLILARGSKSIKYTGDMDQSEF